MYDDYPSPPSTSSSSSRLARNIPQSYLLAANAAPRASKAADLAHLLDPSYSPTRPANHAYLSQIYVDHAGEAHDPDFRFFAPAPASFSPKRREFLTCESDDDADSDAEPDADHEDRIAAIFYAHASHLSPKPRHKRASFDSARSAKSDPAYYGRDAGSEPAYATFEYSFEDQGYVSDEEPRRESNKLRRRRASLEHDRAVERQDSADDKSRADWTASTSSTTAAAAPATCTFTLKRQWHALRLRTQVAAFHARKRVTRMVSPSTG